MSELETLLINLCHELDEIKCLVKISPDKATIMLGKLVELITDTLGEKNENNIIKRS